MASAPPSRDEQIKHLEFIQSVVGRLSNNSFLIKGWALTVAGAFFAFAADRLDTMLAAVGFLPAAAFWWLDAYFLRQERLFRCLYEDVRKGNVDGFSMDTRSYMGNANCTWSRTLRSTTLVVFYGLIAAFGLVVLIASLLAIE